MTNEEKIMLLLEEVCNDEFGEVISDKNWTPCNLTCRQVRKKIEYACINIAQWKDEQLSKCLENLEKEYIRNSGKGLYDNNEIAAKLATLKRIAEEMK